MSRILSPFHAVATVVFMITSAPGAGLLAEADNQSFLTKAAEEQQIEVSLGQLATQRAMNDRVKELGAHMMEDHKKTSQQIEQLAMKEAMQLSPGVSPDRKHEVNELSQLFGHAFDRAYINYILRNHETTVEEFELHMKTSQNDGIKQWIVSTLPLLEVHRIKALVVKYALQTNP
jgi:putative membrane protein